MTGSKPSMKQSIIAALTAACLWAPLPVAQAADLQAGKRLAAETCASCHGPEGRQATAPNYPILAGQYRDYLLHSLKAYQSGKRDNAIMKGMVSGLSEKDLENLAAWYASRDGLSDLSID